jgi:hypothetical protein
VLYIITKMILFVHYIVYTTWYHKAGTEPSQVGTFEVHFAFWPTLCVVSVFIKPGIICLWTSLIKTLSLRLCLATQVSTGIRGNFSFVRFLSNIAFSSPFFCMGIGPCTH